MALDGGREMGGGRAREELGGAGGQRGRASQAATAVCRVDSAIPAGPSTWQYPCASVCVFVATGVLLLFHTSLDG